MYLLSVVEGELIAFEVVVFHFPPLNNNYLSFSLGTIAAAVHQMGVPCSLNSPTVLRSGWLFSQAHSVAGSAFEEPLQKLEAAACSQLDLKENSLASCFSFLQHCQHLERHSWRTMDKVHSHQESYGDLRAPDNFLDGKAIPMLLRKQESPTDLAHINLSTASLSQPSSQYPGKPLPPSPTHSDASIMEPESPEPGSINAILRDHCRTRLYVCPIAWTMDQPRLLGFRFVPRKLSSKLQKRRALGGTTDEQKTTSGEVTGIQQERVREAGLLQKYGIESSCRKGPLGYLLETFNIRVSA